MNPKKKKSTNAQREVFKSKLESIASILNKRSTKSIIMIDELPLHFVVTKALKTDLICQYYDVDLSFLKKFKNVEFVLCIKPWGMSKKFKKYEITSFEDPDGDQLYKSLNKIYRCNDAIKNFLRYYQENDPCKVRRGYPEVDALPTQIGELGGYVWIFQT